MGKWALRLSPGAETEPKDMGPCPSLSRGLEQPLNVTVMAGAFPPPADPGPSLLTLRQKHEGGEWGVTVAVVGWTPQAVKAPRVAPEFQAWELPA